MELVAKLCVLLTSIACSLSEACRYFKLLWHFHRLSKVFPLGYPRFAALSFPEIQQADNSSSHYCCNEG